jgi:GH18 family chitinase
MKSNLLLSLLRRWTLQKVQNQKYNLEWTGGLKTFSSFRQGDAKFTPQNINPYLCTHLIYAFGGLGKDDTIQPFDSYQDIEQGMHT